MNDSNGKEIEVGHKVIVYCMTGLRAGHVARIRQGTRYGRDVEQVRVVFEVPEQVYKKKYQFTENERGYRDYAKTATGDYIWNMVLSRTNRHKDFTEGTRIYILDNSAE